MPSQNENEENPINYSQSFRKSMKQLKIALEFQPSALNTNPHLTCPFLIHKSTSTTKRNLYYQGSQPPILPLLHSVPQTLLDAYVISFHARLPSLPYCHMLCAIWSNIKQIRLVLMRKEMDRQTALSS